MFISCLLNKKLFNSQKYFIVLNVSKDFKYRPIGREAALKFKKECVIPSLNSLKYNQKLIIDFSDSYLLGSTFSIGLFCSLYTDYKYDPYVLNSIIVKNRHNKFFERTCLNYLKGK